MTNIDIKINTKYLMDYSASLKRTVGEDTLLLIIKSFATYIKNFYGCLIEESINSPRYKGKWEPIDEEGYLEYLGTVPEKRILYYIRDALEVTKQGSNYIIRIDPHYRYPKSRLPLVRVLRAIECGTRDFVARPILAKSARKIRSHILQLWKGYLSMKGVG